MKKLAFFVLLGAAAPAAAQQATTPVAEQFQSSMTCQGISISSQTPTNVTVSTNTFSWRSVSIQDRDSSANIFCSENVNVSTQAASTQAGQEVAAGTASAPGATVVWQTVPGEQIYCLNDSATKAVNATVCRGY